MYHYLSLSRLRHLAVFLTISFIAAHSLVHAQSPPVTVADIEMLLSVKMADDVIIARVNALANRSTYPPTS